MRADDFLDDVGGDGGGPGIETVVPPEVQAGRDRVRLRMIEAERASESDPRIAAAMDTEIASTRGKLPTQSADDFLGPEPAQASGPVKSADAFLDEGPAPKPQAPSPAPSPAVGKPEALQPAFDEFSMLRDEAARTPAPQAPGGSILDQVRGTSFNPQANAADALALESAAAKAKRDTLTGPMRPGPTIEAAEQLQRERIQSQAQASQPAIERAHRVASSPIPESEGREGRLLGDVANLLISGDVQAVQDTSELVRRGLRAAGGVPGKLVDAAMDAAWRKATGVSMNEVLKSGADAATERLSPDQRESMEAKWWDEKTNSFGPAWAEPRAYMAGVLQSLPEQVLMMAPAAAAARGAYLAKVATMGEAAAAKAAARAAVLTGAVTEGSLGGAQSGRQVRDEIMGMKDADLVKSDAYRALLDAGMDAREAREKLANDASAQAFILGGIANGLFSGVGDLMIARAVTKGLPGGALRKFILGGAAESLEEYPQNFWQQVAENYSLQTAKPDKQLLEDAINQGLQGAAAAFVQGGTMGTVASHEGAQAAPESPADRARREALAKWEAFRQLVASGAPQDQVQAAQRDLPPLDFVPREPGEGLSLVPREQQGAAAPEGIPFPQASPLDRASAVEAAIAQNEDTQRRRAEGIDFTPTPVPKAPLAVAPEGGTRTVYGNEIDAEPFFREMALLKANNLPVGKWMGGGDLIGRPFDDETIAILQGIEHLSDTNPAAALDALRSIEAYNGKDDHEGTATRTGAAPAQDAQALRNGEEAGRESQAARGTEGAAKPQVGGENAAQVRNEQRGGVVEHQGNDGLVQGEGEHRQHAPEEPGAGAQDRNRDRDAQAPRVGDEGRGPVVNADGSIEFTPSRTVDQAAHAAATSPKNGLPEPTPAQKEAGNYPKGHVRLAGMDVSIENPAGSKRRPEWPKLKSHYGYIRRSEGADGDHVDAFVKPGTPRDWEGPVFVIDQLKSKGSKFDEHKVVLGASSIEEAKRLYAENYTKGWKVGPVTQMALPQFRAWLASPFTKRPVKGLSLSEWNQINPVLEPRKEVASPAVEKPEVARLERRKDASRRKAIEDLAPDEMRAEIERLRRERVTDALTGLGNRTGYEEAPKRAAQASIDADGLGGVNDAMGHTVGDEYVKALGHALRDEGLDAYRISGDEFRAQADDAEQLRSALGRARDRLRRSEFTATLQDGSTVTKKGVEFSYGIGKDFEAADAALYADKRGREAAGERAPKGGEPPGMARVPAQQADRAGREAGPERPEQITETPPQGGVSASEVDRAALTAYAQRLVASGKVQSVELVGSATTSANPNDLDMLYDLGPGLEDTAAVERVIESIDGLDLDRFDTFIKSGERYFHVGKGAGRAVVENDSYAMEQQGKPRVRLATGHPGNLDGAAAHYAQGEPGSGMLAQDVRDTLKPAIERSRVPVDVFQTVEELRKRPGYASAPEDTKGGYFDGRIALVADNLEDALDAERTLTRHEITHAGIAIVYGGSAARERALREIITKNPAVARMASDWRILSSQRVTARYREQGLGEEAARKAVLLDSFEEGLAYYAQHEGNRLNGWRAFVVTIQKGLRALGMHRLAAWIESQKSPEFATIEFLDQLRRATERDEMTAAPGAPSELQPAFARSGREDAARLERATRRMDEMVGMWEKGTLADSITASLGETPRAMQIVGAPAKPLYIMGAVVSKAFSPSKHGHQIAPATLREIPAQLLEPSLIFRSETEGARGALVVVTELMDRTGNPVIVPIHVNVQEGRIEANRIASVYGREEGMKKLEDWARRGMLLYADKSKTANAPATTNQLSPGTVPSPGRFFQVVQQGEAANPNLRSDADVVNRWGAMFARTRESQPLEWPGGTNRPASGTNAAPSGTQAPGGGTNPPAGGTPPQGPTWPGTTLGNPNGWTGPAASRFDNLVYTLQDKHIDTKRVVRAIESAVGSQLADKVDPYLQEELFHGRAAKAVDDFLSDELKPLLKDMATRGVKMEQFEEWLHARHAEERNRQIAKINPQLPDGGSGMTNADARATLARYRQQGLETAMQALAKRVDAITNRTRQLLVGYGLEEANAVNAWAQAYQHYVPLQREDMDSGPAVGQGFSVRGAQKRATGSTRAVVNILANVALARERAIVRGEKNRVANALVGLATANPNPAFWQVDQPPTVKSVDPRSGLVTTHVDPLYKSRHNVIVARTPDANGNIVEHAVVFNEHDERALRMARALKNLDADQLGTVLGTVAKATRFFAAMSTQYNPVFGVVNITRDTQEALLNLTSTPLAGKQGEVFAHVPSALRGIYADLRAVRAGNHPTSQWAQLFEEFQNEGGKTGYRDMFRTSNERAEAMQRELERAAGKGGITYKAIQPVANWLTDYNEAMENAVRLSVYKAGVDHGLSKQRAASVAKNITVNFNRKGQATTQAGALYAFFNASVQGSARLAQTIAGPGGAKIVAGGVLLGVLQAVALALAGFDDDEPPEFVRQKNLIIPLKPITGDKKYLTIPMSLGFLVFPNLGRIATEYVLSGFKKPGKRASDLLGAVVDAFSPVGNVNGVDPKSLAAAISPTVADPIVALAMNQDWTGHPIAREDFDKRRPTPGYKRAKDTATEFSKWTSRAINTMSGGTAHKPGMFSPTPDQIDYLIGQIAGGVGREISKATQTGMALYSGEALPPYKIPLAGRFYGDAENASAHASKFYDNLRDIGEHRSELEGRRRAHEPVGDYIRENPDARLVGRATAAEKQVAQLRRRRHDLLEKGAPREQVRAIEDRLDREMTRFNDDVARDRAAQ